MAFSYSGDRQAELIGFAAVVANHEMVFGYAEQEVRTGVSEAPLRYSIRLLRGG